ncbi:MAG TPA: hypothetical protein VI653_28055 [Steroidobacteraceae bacterium]
MDESSNKWMAYIDTEVRAACEKKGWGSQVRRKWSVRDKPVSESPVDDYEWKLIPDARVRLSPQEPSQFDEGVYYVLSVDLRAKKFVLQHDTAHCGDFGPHWYQQSFTEIQFAGLGDVDYMKLFLQQVGDSESQGRAPAPTQSGQLRDLLVNLTSRFQPNRFSIT